MLLATGYEVVGHGATAVGARGGIALGPVSQRLLRRLAAGAFLAALIGIGLAFPIV